MKKLSPFMFLSLFGILIIPQKSFSQNPLFEDTAHVFETFYFQSSSVGDYDGDGYLDVVLCDAIDTNNSGSPDTSFCQLYKNNAGVFEAVEEFSVISKHLGDVTFVNANNNGLLDIVISGQSYDNLHEYFTYFYKNTGSGFELVQTFPGYTFAELGTADLNADGKLDVVSNGRSSNATFGPETIFYENLGDFDFERHELPVIATQMMGSMKLVDVNNDNLVDIVLMGMDEAFQASFNVFLNTGDGFELHQSMDGVTFGSLNYADFNGDGYQDLVINGLMVIDGVSQPVLRVYWNDGTGTFTPISFDNPVQNSSGTRSIEVGDLNGNGYYDFIVFGEPESLIQKTYIYAYNPNTNDFDLFEDETGILDIGANADVQLLDYNNNNHLDILVSGYSTIEGSLEGVTKLYRNTSTTPNEAPTPPTVLNVTEDGEYLVFEWEGATDDKTPQEALRYEIRIGSESGAEDLTKYMITTPSWKINTEALPEDGFYWAVRSIDASKVYSEESDEAVYGSLSVGDFDASDLKIYPNPTHNLIHIAGKNIQSISIYGIEGKRVHSQKATNENQVTISLEKLQTGVYIVEVTNNTGIKTTKTLIKN